MARYQADLLVFMRQQRCGYNPFLDVECHQHDGRTAYGPRPESTYIDVTGGWHDAGDQLKYLITSSNATARMLLAYELQPEKFGDVVDALGHPSPNGIPDVLDEAKWGLDWMHKMHPAPDELYHQVADDRDHTGWKWPQSRQVGLRLGAQQLSCGLLCRRKAAGTGTIQERGHRHRESGGALRRGHGHGLSDLEGRPA